MSWKGTYDLDSVGDQPNALRFGDLGRITSRTVRQAAAHTLFAVCMVELRPDVDNSIHGRKRPLYVYLR